MTCFVGKREFSSLALVPSGVAVQAVRHWPVPSIADFARELWQDQSKSDYGPFASAALARGQPVDWDMAYRARYERAIRVLASTETGLELFKTLSCGTGLVVVPSGYARGYRQWPRSPFEGEPHDSDSAEIPDWYYVSGKVVTITDSVRLARMYLEAASLIKSAGAQGQCPRVVAEWKRPKKQVISMWQHGTDYVEWQCPSGWSFGDIAKHEAAMKVSWPRAMVWSMAAALRSTSPDTISAHPTNEAFLQLGLSLDQVVALRNTAAGLLWQNDSKMNPARAALCEYVGVLIGSGWVPVPLPVILAHELIHLACWLAPYATMELWATAVECVQDSATRRRINCLYFGEDFTEPMEPSVSVLAAVKHPEFLDRLLKNDVKDHQLRFGLVELVKRVSECAAVYGCAKVTGRDDPIGSSDELSVKIWKLSENSVRGNLGWPARTRYTGSFAFPWLGYPHWLWSGMDFGCTGGRYPWAPEGLAKLCGTKDSHPWFQ